MEIRIKPHTEVRKGCGMRVAAPPCLRSYGASHVRTSVMVLA